MSVVPLLEVVLALLVLLLLVAVLVLLKELCLWGQGFGGRPQLLFLYMAAQHMAGTWALVFARVGPMYIRGFVVR